MSDTHRVTVVGAGYVGLATGVGLATRGHTVDVVEVRPDRLVSLREGRLPIHEPAMLAAFSDPAVRARIRPREALAEEPPDLLLICVGTPVGDDGRSDLRQMRAALEACRPLAAAGVPIAIRSTLPVGSNDQIVEWAGGDASRIFTNPEFLAQGRALEDFLEPSRIVIGTFSDPDPRALEAVIKVLDSSSAPVLVVTVAEADLIKNGANAFLALKISFANELAVLCEHLGVDVGQVIEGIGLDPRIGSNYMHPGLGFGGSCLPKDLRSMTNVGRDLGVEMHIAAAVAESNEAHQRLFATRVARLVGQHRGRVALLGLAFKAGTDDVRYSPALRVAELLLERGLDLVGYDPYAGRNAAAALPELAQAPSAMEALEGAGLAVIATEWPEFRALDWAAAARVMAAPVLLDGRRLLDGDALRALGFRYETVGAPVFADRVEAVAAAR
jgi:UDPglucose 6-dehydrogenase